jgi:hypothetical protein
MYLFALEGGGKKLTYGQNPADALAVLSLRLTPEERAMIIEDEYIQIRQQEMQKYIHLLR